MKVRESNLVGSAVVIENQLLARTEERLSLDNQKFIILETKPTRTQVFTATKSKILHTRKNLLERLIPSRHPAFVRSLVNIRENIHISVFQKKRRRKTTQKVTDKGKSRLLIRSFRCERRPRSSSSRRWVDFGNPGHRRRWIRRGTGCRLTPICGVGADFHRYRAVVVFGLNLHVVGVGLVHHLQVGHFGRVTFALEMEIVCGRTGGGNLTNVAFQRHRVSLFIHVSEFTKKNEGYASLEI